MNYNFWSVEGKRKTSYRLKFSRHSNIFKRVQCLSTQCNTNKWNPLILRADYVVWIHLCKFFLFINIFKLNFLRPKSIQFYFTISKNVLQCYLMENVWFFLYMEYSHILFSTFFIIIMSRFLLTLTLTCSIDLFYKCFL